MSQKQNRTNSKKSRTPLIIGVVLAVVAGLGAMAVITGGSSGGGKPLAIPTVPVGTASVQQSLDQFRGKIVILDFWATWCGPCRSEIPGFVALQEQYRSQGVEVIGVSLDPMTPERGGLPAVKPFMESYKINYTIWTIDNIAALGSYDVRQGIPTTYVLDREGRVVSKYVGARPMSVFENDIKKLL